MHLKVADLLTDSKIPTVSSDATLKEVIYEISEKRLGATVVEKNGDLYGLVTDGDIRRVLEKHENISGLKASDVMSKNPIKVNENLKAIEALKLMQIKKINHLVVVEEGNSYLGIVHILDLIKEDLNG